MGQNKFGGLYILMGYFYAIVDLKKKGVNHDLLKKSLEHSYITISAYML